MKNISIFSLLMCIGLFVNAQSDIDSLKSLVTSAKIRVNQGNKYTRSSKISLNITALKAREMMISNESSFSGKHWKPFRQNIPFWEIDAREDGVKTIYLKFRDYKKRESTVFFGDITLDRKAPQNPKVKIITKKELSRRNPSAVELQVEADEGTYVMISNEKRFYGKKWRLFLKGQPIKWSLGGSEDGKRVVFVKFRDHAGNESETVSDEIVIDTRPPIRCKLSIENGKKVTTDSTGNVKLLASALGATQMMISNHENFTDAIWQPYDEVFTWNIGRKDGTRKVYIKFKDDSDNISVVTTANIFQDTHPPYDCGITINHGATKTYNPDGKVSVQLTAQDAEFMMISNSFDFANYKWQRFQKNIPEWKLANGKGARTVYVIFKDKYGNRTGVYEATILRE